MNISQFYYIDNVEWKQLHVYIILKDVKHILDLGVLILSLFHLHTSRSYRTVCYVIWDGIKVYLLIAMRKIVNYISVI